MIFYSIGLIFFTQKGRHSPFTSSARAKRVSNGSSNKAAGIHRFISLLDFSFTHSCLPMLRQRIGGPFAPKRLAGVPNKAQRQKLRVVSLGNAA